MRVYHHLPPSDDGVAGVSTRRGKGNCLRLSLEADDGAAHVDDLDLTIGVGVTVVALVTVEEALSQRFHLGAQSWQIHGYLEGLARVPHVQSMTEAHIHRLEAAPAHGPAPPGRRGAREAGPGPGHRGV